VTELAYSQVRLALADTGNGVIKSSRYAGREGRSMSRYQWVIQHILTQIESGELLPGAKLPSTSQLASELGVSKSLVTNAMRSLEERKVIVGHPGLGRFVAGDDNPVDAPEESA
jgi:GntR family transcriptional regulator